MPGSVTGKTGVASKQPTDKKTQRKNIFMARILTYARQITVIAGKFRPLLDNQPNLLRTPS
jgi:hypothetical protein